jgi:hypothetical protein
MKAFLEVAVPGYKPYHRNTISKKIKENFIDFRQKLRNALEKVEYCAVTTDLWKNRNGANFMCFTCHFLDDNFNFHSLVISFRRFYRRYLSDNLREKIINEMKNIGILQKCLAITTDNASDIKS